ncbi:MAG: AAA family ATPase, partial [Phycisphaerales bacterium]|nr:AAA family ATPase [Phycisphaerales bacterium]
MGAQQAPRQNHPAGDGERIAPEALRWRCDPGMLNFHSTDEVEPIRGVVGQDAAVEALSFGLKTRAHGQNVFVRGLSGTGRMTLIRRLLEEIQLSCPLTADRVYVHNFTDPTRPRLITLARGGAQPFTEAVDRLIEFIANDLEAALRSESFLARMKALETSTGAKIKQAAKPVEDVLAKDDLALVTVTTGRMTHPAVFPRVEGKPMPLEEYAAEKAKGTITAEAYDRTVQAIQSHEELVGKLEDQVRGIMLQHFETSRQVLEAEVRSVLRPLVVDITSRHGAPGVSEFLTGILKDLIDHQLERLAQGEGSLEHYRVNPVLAHEAGQGCSIVIENAPSLSNLIGGIDRRIVQGDVQVPDHMSIRKGALLEADGGFLILEARDVIAEPGAWRALVRTLRANRLEISPPEVAWAPTMALLKPDPVDVNVKVVLLGDHDLFHMLDALDADFAHLFKVVAEFDAVIPRDEEGMQHYAAVIRRIADEDGLPAFSRDAVAALIEHGARIAASRGKLTSRFSRIADIAREAAFLAQEAGRVMVERSDVLETVARTRRRA